ncbi:hypothetical protein QE152_g7848 [Popillia japonica]|uniref:Uncharacterized protein n=1 Tax=Popillia japonica TaxID=7064 RepID=A0AAW1M7H6_POPJA
MSSEDNSDEIKEKKRRATQEIEGAYGRSKRTVKVPNNEPKMEAGKLDRLLEMMKEMKAVQQEIKNDIKEMKEEQKVFKEEISVLKQEIRNLQKENDVIKRKNEEKDIENKEIKAELEVVRKNIEYIERERKRKNVMISGHAFNDKGPEELKVVTNTSREKEKGKM